MTETTSGVVVPSSPSDLQKIKSNIKDASDIMTMIEAKKDTLRDIKTYLKEEYELPPKLITKLINAYHKQSFEAMQQESEDFETLYEKVVGQPEN